MTENLNKRPPKSILKSSSSFDKPQQPPYQQNAADALLGATSLLHSAAGSVQPKSAKFDEMNIIETLHPADKDYGHMKIEEPKTPFSYLEENYESLDAEQLNERITAKLSSNSPPRALARTRSSDSESSEGSAKEDPEEKKVFDAKRKAHYNEYYAVKLARKLMEDEEEDEDEDGQRDGGSRGEKFIPQEEAEIMEEV